MVAASTTHAECIALYEAIKEALWLKSLAANVNVNIDKSLIIYEENNGCICIANNRTNHKRSKYIDIKYNFLRGQVNKNVIKLKHISTGNQIVDTFYKATNNCKNSCN